MGEVSLPGLYAAKLTGTQPDTLKSLAQAAVEASQALVALTASDMPLPAEDVLCAAEKRALYTQQALADFLFDRFGIGSALARDLGGVLA